MTVVEFITLACTNPDRLASFWERAIDGERRDLPSSLEPEIVDRLRELGASVRETKTETHETRTAVWTILEDPAGNGFCVSEYDR